MHKAAEYRGLAAKYRRLAEKPELAHEREANLAAADKWDYAADQVEATSKTLFRDLPIWRL